MNWIGLWTLIKRENVRSIKIINQVIWPPIISSLLYILIFGLSLGKNFEIGEVDYLAFIMPGLIMMNVIMSSYEESASSLFLGKFIHYIDELLVAPLSYIEVVLGFIIGSIARAVFIAHLILFTFMVFLSISIHNIFMYIYFMVMVAVLFGSVGIIFALWAEKFDNLAVFNTFFITPLVFLGGVFHSISILPPLFQSISKYNPILYMIDGFRYSLLGVNDVPIHISLILVTVMSVAAFLIATYLFKSGYKLKT